MVRVGTVWDSTTQVLAGRAGVLAPIAALAFWLPAVAQAAIRSYASPTPGILVLNSLVTLAALVATLWGQLAMVAVASDPATTRAEAMTAATRRLPPALGVTLLLAAALIVAAVPVIIVLRMTGFDWQAATAQAGSAGAPPMAAGAALFTFLYALLFAVFGLWLAARIFLMNVVVLNERRGIGAIGRSVQLTRGLTFRLIGILLLLIVLLVIGSFAAQSVVFVVVRLLLGAEHIPTARLVGAAAGAAVGAAFSTVASVFAARLYAAVREPK